MRRPPQQARSVRAERLFPGLEQGQGISATANALQRQGQLHQMLIVQFIGMRLELGYCALELAELDGDRG